tara:strand:+ start:13699 stop:14637 length:939 start_codon:yes stop_codon:yes gene_type:complete
LAIQGGYDLTMVGIEAEATFGTDAADTRVRWPGIVTSIPNPTEDYGKTVIRGLGSGRDPGMFYRTKKEVGLVIDSLLNQDTTGAASIFGLALGTCAGGTVTNTDALRSFTLETGWNDGSSAWYELYTGCRVESLSLEMNSGEACTLSTTLFAKELTRGAAEVNCATTDLSELSEHATKPFTMEDVTVGFASFGSEIVTNMTIDINNVLSRVYGLSGSATIAESFATKRDVTGSFTLIKQDDSAMDKFLSDPFNNSETITVTLSKNSAAEKVVITLTDCRLLSRDFSRPGDDVKELEESYDFHAASITVDQIA